jgi:hypothetical protein
VETPLKKRGYTPSAVAPVEAFKVEALRTVELELETVSTGASLTGVTVRVPVAELAENDAYKEPGTTSR